MFDMDQLQWLRGIRLLSAAAAAGNDAQLALRCHLRLLNALLPATPAQLLPVILSGKAEGERQQPQPLPTGFSLTAAAQEVAAQPLTSATAALDAAAAFLQQARAGNGNQLDMLALHPLESCMFGTVLQQLLHVLASCCAALAAAGPATAENRLNLKASCCRSLLNSSSLALCVCSF